MAFFAFAHILWETSKLTIVLPDNKSVTRFFQTKAVPLSLWNAYDYVLQFTFKTAHIVGSVNTAADFLSRLELKVTEKINLKIREDVQTTPQHPWRCQHLPQMLQMKKISSSREQMAKMKMKSRSYNESSNLRRKQQNR